MLKELTIKDFAIIEDLSIDFRDGMSAILGETGAGKSIIIEAFSLLLGNRANSEMIRTDKTKALVQAIISFENIPEELEEYKDDNNDFIFTRIINKDGNNICKINGISVPINVLKNTIAKKVNLHSQHDVFYLLDSKYHLTLLDRFIGKDLDTLLIQYKKIYNDYLSKVDDYNKLMNENQNIDIDYITYQLEEIEKVNLKENEDQEIEEELSRVSKFDRISNCINTINECFDKQEGIADLLYTVKRQYGYIKDDPLFSEYETKIIDLVEMANDLNDSLKETYNSLDFNEERVEYLKNRSFEINKLKRKYGNYASIMKAKEEYKKQIEYYNDADYYKEKLQKEINSLKEEAYNLSTKLSNLRKEKALEVEEKVLTQLKDLYLDKTIFKAKFTETGLTDTGYDKVEFLISTNVGEELKPLAVVASGGEASRVTLALNVVFNEIFDIDLAIFDEVDTGVSGKIARSIGKKIRELSNNYQTITISHLPQVLTCSNNFYYIGKEVVNGKTRSYVKNLNQNETIVEIAKILSGNDNPNESFLSNARELLEI